MKYVKLVKTLFTDYSQELRLYVARTIGNVDDAEELTQDTFYNFMRRDDIEEIKNPRAYLYKTANNLALNHIRNNKKYNESTESIHCPSKTPSLEREVFAQQDIDFLIAIIDKLPELSRRVFLMNRIDEKSYAEIAHELNMSVSSVGKHIMKVLNFLRENLERDMY